MIPNSFLRLWQLTFQLVQLHILPGQTTKNSGPSKSTSPTTTTTTTTTQVTQTSRHTTVTAPTHITTNTTVTETSRKGEIPGGEISPTTEPSDDRDPGSEGERDGKVGWVYTLRRSELLEEMEKRGLSTEGTVEELRTRFVGYLRKGAIPKTTKAVVSDEDKFSTACFVPPNTQPQLDPSNSGSSEGNRRIQNPQADDPRYFREILGLPPNASSETVKRILTSMVRSANTFSTGLHDLGTDTGYKGLPTTLSTETNVTFTLPQGRQTTWPTYLETDPKRTKYPEIETTRPNTELSPAKLCSMVRKWNLQFDGEHNPVSFLERLGEMMDCYDLNPDDMLKALPEVLKHKALLWYRNERELWSNFQDFQTSFEAQYLPLGYRRNLDEEIRLRTQGEEEPFKNFVVALLTLMRRRGGYTLEEKLDRIYLNMKPEYKLTMRRENYMTVQAMIKEAENYENYIRDKSLYRPPPNPAQALIPETAYHSKSKPARNNNNGGFQQHSQPSTSANRAGNAEPRLINQNRRFSDRQWQASRPLQHNMVSQGDTQQNNERPSNVNDRNSEPKQSVCWNCDESGHRFNDCPKPRVIRCFNCKKEGVRTVHCPCRQGNDSRVPGKGGQLRPKSNPRPPENPQSNRRTE